MDDREALHTAARRYRVERESAIWRAMEVAGQQQTRSAAGRTWRELDVRRDVIKGILRHIEGVVPGTFSSVEALRAFLAETTSPEGDTCPWKEATSIRMSRDTLVAAGDESANFGRYIERLQPDTLHRVQPLPHHRLLRESEAERLWQRLARKWQIPSKGYWWPLALQEAPPPHVLAFNAWEFDEHVSVSLLRDWLRDARARPVLRFDNDNPGGDYEMDLERFALNGRETYWTSPTMDWVIYRSHEDSLTIGGE